MIFQRRDTVVTIITPIEVPILDIVVDGAVGAAGKLNLGRRNLSLPPLDQIRKRSRIMWGCNYFPYFSWAGKIFPGGIFSILLWGLIIWLLALLVMKLFGSLRSNRIGQNKDRYDSLGILKTRYARGEISDEEFVRMKNILLYGE